ncbi:MAG: hypothetical protein AAFU64_05280 [Bacteroidota bacterium]
MLFQFLLTFSFLTISLFSGCIQENEEEIEETASPTPSLEEEKTAILATLNAETKAALSRDYEAWKRYWVQEAYVSKHYLNFADSSLSEYQGWTAIDDFVRTYIEEHPEPVPLPTPLEELDLRLYGSGAWVHYEQMDAVYGRKRESRLMEKVEGEWKIAGMQTVIYGFPESE